MYVLPSPKISDQTQGGVFPTMLLRNENIKIVLLRHKRQRSNEKKRVLLIRHHFSKLKPAQLSDRVVIGPTRLLNHTAAGQHTTTSISSHGHYPKRAVIVKRNKDFFKNVIKDIFKKLVIEYEPIKIELHWFLFNFLFCYFFRR